MSKSRSCASGFWSFSLMPRLRRPPWLDIQDHHTFLEISRGTLFRHDWCPYPVGECARIPDRQAAMPKLSISIQVDQNGQHAISSYGDPSLWPFVGRLAACYHPQKTSADGADARAQDSKADIALATLGWSGFGDIQRWAEAVRECALRGEDYLAARAVSEATAAPIRERLRLPESTTPLEVLVAVANCHAAKADAVRGLESQVNKIDAVLRPLVTSDEDDDGHGRI